MKKLLHHLFHCFLYGFAGFIVLLAILLILARASTPYLNSHKDRIVELINQRLDLPISIEDIRADWQGLSPELSLNHVTLYSQADQKRVLAQLNHITIGFDIVNSLLKQTFEPGTIVLSGVAIPLWQNPDGSFRIRKDLKKMVQKEKSMPPYRIIAWLAEQDTIAVENVNLELHLNNQKRIKIDAINIELHNELTQYVLSGDFVLNQQGKNSTVEFSSTIQGKLSKHKLKHWHSLSDVIENTNVKTYIAARHLQLAPWFALLPQKIIQLHDGQGLIQWWFQWNGKQQTLQSQARIRLRNLNLEKNTFRYQQPYLSGVLSLSLSPSDWELTGDKLRFRSDAKRDHQFAIDGKMRLGQPSQIQAVWISRLRIARLNELLQKIKLKKPDIQTYLNRLKPTGELRDVYFSLNQTKKGPAWVLISKLHNLTIKPWGSIPGVSHVTGTVQITPYHGFVQLDSQGLTLTDPKRFSNAIAFDTVNANLHWTYGKQGWLININQLAFENPFIQIHGDTRLFIPREKEVPTLELALQTSSKQIGELKSLYPKPYLPKDTYDWLTQSILRGELREGKIVLRGPVDHFPFDDQTGIFQVNGEIHDAALRPDQGWPILDHLNGTLSFNQNSLTAKIPSAKTYRTNVNNAVVQIKRLSQPSPLLIQMRIDGQANDITDYLHDTPLKSLTSPFSNQLQLTGSVNGDVKLAISLDNGELENLLTLMQLHDVNLKHKHSPFEIKQINGSMLIHNQWVTGQTLTARFLGEPAQLDIKTVIDKKKPSVVAELHSTLAMDTLRSQIKSAILNRFSGKIPIILRSKVSFDPTQAIQLQAQSDLLGLSVKAPNPLSKQANQRFASEINALVKQGNISQIDFHYGAELAGIAKLKTSKDLISIERAQLVLGRNTATLPNVSGITIGGHLPKLNLDRWFGVVERYQTKKTTAKPIALSDYLKQVTRLNLSFDYLTVLKQVLTPVKLKASITPSEFVIHLDSPQAKGDVTLPTKLTDLSVSAKMRYLHITVPKEMMEAESKLPIDPARLPKLALNIQQLFVNNDLIGDLTLRAYPVETGMSVKQLVLTMPYMRLVTNGSWLYDKQSTISQFKGKISTNNVTDFLHHVSNITDIEGKHGQIDFDLHWPKPPFQFALTQVSGQAQLSLDEGRITYVASGKQKEKMDLGRLLNVFNFSSLSRRLKLDFSDLTKQGYSFDSVTGSFYLEQGRANTNDTIIKGSIADLDLSGSFDLVKKYYNLILGVTPHLTSSLPVIATVAGTAALGPLGPVIGAATWVVDKVAINPGVGKLTHFSYRITGPFSKPAITPLKAKLPKK